MHLLCVHISLSFLVVGAVDPVGGFVVVSVLNHDHQKIVQVRFRCPFVGHDLELSRARVHRASPFLPTMLFSVRMSRGKKFKVLVS
jgi:hypothetical protein